MSDGVQAVRLPRATPIRAWDWLRGSAGGLQVLAVGVGVGAGLGAVAFRWLIVGATRLLSGHTDYAASPGAANPYAPGIGRWFLLAAPVVAGLIYGPRYTSWRERRAGTAYPR